MTTGISLRSAIRADIKHMPCGLEIAPAVVGVAFPETVCNYICDTKRGTHCMSLDQFEALVEWTGGVHAAQALAEMAGGVFVPTEIVEMADGDLFKEIASTLRHFSALVSTIQDAVADGRVSNGERAAIRAQKVELVQAVYRLVSQVNSIRG